MDKNFNLSDIYDKNINFIIGSGASYGLFPILKVETKGPNGEVQTIETLATYFESKDNKKALSLLFMHYFKTCIEPILSFDYLKAHSDAKAKPVIENYQTFIKTILYLLNKKKSHERKMCNVFTTNYDGCIIYSADEIIKSGSNEFVLNDGARGFFKRYLAAKNYNSYTKQSGTFERYSTQIPQLNLVSLHGSGAWIKDGETILVDYSAQKTLTKECTDAIPDISSFSACLNDSNKKISDLEKINLEIPREKEFTEAYKKLPIVNPTKWKFHETVFEEHYYQMLRYLSYELERPNTVLISFGFSFADEHIFNLVKRSLANPFLQLFVFCFNDEEKKSLGEKFKAFNNVTIFTDNSGLDFLKFNNDFFTLDKKAPSLTAGTP
jgi:hypothetical protein